MPPGKAILICDQVIHGCGRNKQGVIGAFGDIHALRFPSRCSRIAVYINLTAAQRAYVLEVGLLDTWDGKRLPRDSTTRVTSDRPLRSSGLALQIRKIAFRYPGKCELQVLADGDPLSTKASRVKRLEAPRHPGEPLAPGKQGGGEA